MKKQINILNYFSFISLMLVAVAGCAKHAEPLKAQPPPRHFFSTDKQDTKLDFNQAKPLRSSIESIARKSALTVNSKDWLELSDQLLEAGEVMPEVYGRNLSNLGHELGRSFYRDTNAFTTISGTTRPPGSPYAEVAQYYAIPTLQKKIVASANDALELAKTAAAQTIINAPEVTSDSNSSKVIDAIVTGLTRFANELKKVNQQKNGESLNEAVAEIAEKIQDHYIQDLLQFKQLSERKEGQSVNQYLGRLRDRIKSLEEFSREDRQKLSRQLERGRVVAELLEKIVDARGELKLLCDLWTSRSLRAEFPPSARAFFEKFDRNQLIALAANNVGKIDRASDWDQLKNRHDYGVLNSRDLLSAYLHYEKDDAKKQLVNNEDWQKLNESRLYAINVLVKEKDVRDFAYQVNPEKIEDDEDAFITLINNWLAITFKLSAPSDLHDVFNTLTDSEIMLIGDEPLASYLLHWKLVLIRNKIIDKLETFGSVSSFKNMVEQNVLFSTQAKINMSLKPIVKNFSGEIVAKLEPSLRTQIDQARQTSGELYRKFGRYYLGQKIFNVTDLTLANGPDSLAKENSDNLIISQKRLPLLELSNIHFYNSGGHGQGLSLFVSDSREETRTSAELLGIALSQNLHRLKTMEFFENITPESQEAVTLQFELYNKLLAMGGFTTETGELISSLAVSTSLAPGTRANLNEYHPETASFAIPDDLLIENNFKLDPQTERQVRISLSGQMELLRGFSQIMEFTKPWQSNSFDLGLPKIRLKEDPTIIPFSKEHIFALSFGLSSMILRNIQYKMLGFIRSDDQFIEAKTIDDISQIHPSAATLSSYEPLKMAHIVTASETAKAIIGLSEFLTATDDIDKADFSSFKDAAISAQIISGRENARRLLTGLTVFVTKYLLSPDGGAAVGYDLDRHQIIGGERSLSDQIIIQDALIKASKYLGVDYFISRALENLFFINKSFWNADLGFYSEHEDKLEKTVKLVNVARVLKNMESFKTLMQNFLTQSPSFEMSLQQISKLESFLSHRFFSQSDLNPLVQVLDFSL
jgi:hypothetical protein